MPFPMKIQPFDPSIAIKPAPKSRLKRLFEKQFAGVLRNTSSEKLDAEVGSICLDKMVINFIEETGDNNSKGKCGKSRCNCFHGNCDDISDDEADLTAGDPPAPAISSADAADLIKGMVVCASVSERNLLADVAALVDKHKAGNKHKNELRRIVADGLRSNGRDASVCKSRWDKSPSFPSGEYEYIDVVHDGPERIIVDIDFKSEFEIARSTKSHRAVLQSLPSIFVGKSDRLLQIISIVSESAKLSLKKKGLSFPPWRKTEYMRNKWLSDNYERLLEDSAKVRDEISAIEKAEEKSTAVIEWELPSVKPKVNNNNNNNNNNKTKVVTGLGFLLRDGLI
ncbi:hypothetical protein LUZ60_005864 [Juncus effusus]|nr:hypothetical protein LUZ60_005864 [Juncus effusus]